jgi:hypothetical protein
MLKSIIFNKKKNKLIKKAFLIYGKINPINKKYFSSKDFNFLGGKLSFWFLKKNGSSCLIQ